MSVPYIVYDSVSGIIRQVGSVPEGDLDKQAFSGEEVIRGTADMMREMVNPTTQRVVPRPIFAGTFDKVQISADLTDIAHLSPCPVGTGIIVDGPVSAQFTVDTPGDLSLRFDTPGTYQVKVFPVDGALRMEFTLNVV